MREVAREPQELELEREDERVERGLGGQSGLDSVEKVEEARQRVERSGVRVLLDEEAEHRLEADVADRHSVAVDAGALVGAQEVGAADCAQLPPPLVQHELDVAEGLEPGAEARLRLAHSLRDRPDPAALERVEVKDAIRLGEADRPQDDSLRLERARRHGPSLVVEPARSGGIPGHSGTLKAAMARIQMYSTTWCGYCVRAKALLERRGLEYEEILMDDDPAFRQKLLELTGRWTVPQIFIDGEAIGGYTELWGLERDGRLDELAA